MEPIHTEEYKGYTIEIHADDVQGDSPRDWDNLGTMVCWHRRYNLGDEHNHESPGDLFWKLACDVVGYDKVNAWADGDKLTIAQIDARVKKIVDAHIIYLPIYAYEHSGITISTGRGYPYNDAWDSGQLGYIYVTRKDALKNWSRKHMTKKFRTRAEQSLRNEVQTYDDYLTGNVYGFIVKDSTGEQVESCWGMYPDHEAGSHGYQYCLREAMSVVDYLTDESNKRAAQKTQELNAVKEFWGVK